MRSTLPNDRAVGCGVWTTPTSDVETKCDNAPAGSSSKVMWSSHVTEHAAVSLPLNAAMITQTTTYLKCNIDILIMHACVHHIIKLTRSSVFDAAFGTSHQ